MKFVQSLDDSVFTHVAGGLTVGAATITALCSGHTMLNPHSSLPPHYPDGIEVSYNAGDTGISDSAVDAPPEFKSAYADVILGQWPVSGTEPTVYSPLCVRILQKEDEVDALNTQLDGLLADVKSRRNQRRK